MPGGRPSKYSEDYVAKAEELARLGATDVEMADYFGVANSTFSDWKVKFPEFSEAIKAGKLPSDSDVANALYQRATGAEWVEEQAIKVKEVEYSDGKRVRETERVEVVEVTRRAPPDTTSMIFWLKNRRAVDWRDKKEVDVRRIDEMTEEELDAAIADRERELAALEGRTTSVH